MFWTPAPSPPSTHSLSWRRLYGTRTGKPRFLRMMCLQDARIHIVCGYRRPFSVCLMSALYLVSLLRRRKSSRDLYLWFRNTNAFPTTMATSLWVDLSPRCQEGRSWWRKITGIHIGSLHRPIRSSKSISATSFGNASFHKKR